MGGGPVASAIKNHIKKGFNVFMTESSARTVRDNLNEVKNMGIDIVHSVLNPDITFKDIDLKLFNDLTGRYYPDEDFDIFVAVQDHGYVSGTPDRKTRMEFLRQFLQDGLKKAFFSEKDLIPQYLTRFNSIKNQLENAGVSRYRITDTAIAAALGATFEADKFPVLTIDAGNGHTFAAIVNENRHITGFFEHHTGMLSPAKINYFVKKLTEGSLTGEEIYEDNGHGAIIFEKCKSVPHKIYVTGPRRQELFKNNEDVIFASPLGDMMITGPVGQFMQADLM